MFYSIKGSVEITEENKAVIENGGICYEVTVSANTAVKLAGKKEALVYTYLQVKEDGLTLYGFYSKEEKRMFENLITVSGVGCKVAVAALSGMPLESLALCIAEENVKMLSGIKGIGKKTAERIILELKEKVAVSESGTAGFESEGAAYEVSASESDALAALAALGIKRNECAAAVKQAVKSGADTTEKIIGYVLKNM